MRNPKENPTKKAVTTAVASLWREGSLGELQGFLDSLNTPPDLNQLAGSLNVVKIVPSSEVANAAVYRSKEGFVIVVNNQQSQSRQKFSLAHELGHILLNQELSNASRADGWVTLQRDRAIEKKCNRLAGSMLMPRSAFLRDAGRAPLSPFGLRWLAGQFGVSLWSAAIRWGEVGPQHLAVFKSSLSSRTRRPAIEWASVHTPDGMKRIFIPKHKHVDHMRSVDSALRSRTYRTSWEQLGISGIDGEFNIRTLGIGMKRKPWAISVVPLDRRALSHESLP